MPSKIEKTEMPTLHIGVRQNTVENSTSLMIGIPTTGVVRYEWHIGVLSLTVPVCMNLQPTAAPIQWASPVGYHVAEARNLIVKDFIKSKCEWLFFLDHDVIPQPDLYVHLLQYMESKKYPVVCGLYYAKGNPPSPLLFRGRGNSSYTKWEPGDKVMVDGIPMGCTLIHRSILEHQYKKSRKLQTRSGEVVREVFKTPREIWFDPETQHWGKATGTEDLWWCEELIKNKVFEETGWPKFQKKKYPFLIDTKMFCKHISYDGKQYP